MFGSALALLFLVIGTDSLETCNLLQVKGAGGLGPFDLSVAHHRNPPFFAGAKLELIIFKDETLMNYVLSDVTGALAIEGQKVVVVKNIDGGKVIATEGDYACEVTLGPFRNTIGGVEQDNWVYIQKQPVDFFSTAVQTVNGAKAVGEYFLDRSGKEIHLRSDASSLYVPHYNWFQVETGAPADLEVDPNTSEAEFKNGNYVAPTLPQMLTAGQMTTITGYWGTMFTDPLDGNTLAWTYKANAGPKPFIDAESDVALPYGTSGLVDLLTAEQTVRDASKPLGIVLSFTAFKKSDEILPIDSPTPLPGEPELISPTSCAEMLASYVKLLE